MIRRKKPILPAQKTEHGGYDRGAQPAPPGRENDRRKDRKVGDISAKDGIQNAAKRQGHNRRNHSKRVATASRVRSEKELYVHRHLSTVPGSSNHFCEKRFRRAQTILKTQIERF